MSPLVKSDDFPLTKKCAYINAANVALMPKPSIEAINKWHNDVGLNGSNNFNDLVDKIRSIKNLRIGVYPINEKNWIDLGTWKEYEKNININI